MEGTKTVKEVKRTVKKAAPVAPAKNTGKAVKKTAPVASAKKKTPEKATTAVDVYSPEMVRELSKRTRMIRTEMNKVESSFTKIAFNLHWIYTNGSFKALGADNIYTFAKNEFGIARGTTSNFINVVERFGKKIDGRIVEEIDENYRGYNSSQLITMLGIDDENLKKVHTDMSVREIKKVKKEVQGDTNTGKKKASATAEKETVVDVESAEVNRTVMITVKDLDDYQKHMDMIETQIRRALVADNGKYKVEIAYTWA